ncbi:MAG TPA: hypothetical protein VM262_13300 [Acidimicrobiales bacterium]|nr:hypothetical protein [Acidimicrobiales bacterium]
MDLGGVERELCRIPEVQAARIVADEHGRPVEVHILATTGKGAKQLVRDVQSVAIASGGIDFDHRIVSVVQLETEHGAVAPSNGDAKPTNGTSTVTAPKPATTERVVVESVVVAKKELQAVATVTLRHGDDEVVGTAQGTIASTARWRIVAEASLNALRLLEPAACSVAIEMAGVQRVGDRELGIVTLVLVIPPNEELLAGVAPVRGSAEDDAIARAVLDATNRRLARLR